MNRNTQHLETPIAESKSFPLGTNRRVKDSKTSCPWPCGVAIGFSDAALKSSSLIFYNSVTKLGSKIGFFIDKLRT